MLTVIGYSCLRGVNADKFVSANGQVVVTYYRHRTSKLQTSKNGWGTVITPTVSRIGYQLNDKFDLSGQNGRSGAYNNIRNVTGFIYHNVTGGNSEMQVSANWETTIK